MVTTDISQLATECNTWKLNLRTLRDDLTQCKNQLQEVVSRQVPKSMLPDIEHYQNQFHIQLINIHDLKQAIKENERIAGWELSSDKGISDGVWAKHEELYHDYQHLDHTLRELKGEFHRFIQGFH